MHPYPNATQSDRKVALRLTSAQKRLRAADLQRLRAARYRAKPGTRQKEAARLRRWRALRRTQSST